jgi:DNA (cytosine-5)-methyltransferase 1
LSPSNSSLASATPWISLTYGSVCSGIEAVTLAWKPLGLRPAWFAEIDPFCCALLKHHYPDVPNLGDFTAIERSRSPIDILAGGTPCQSFSIAGRRGGLDDARGSLAIEFCRLAGRLRPRWILWENVPGVLSSNCGRDFGAILGALGQLGYGCAWRVLDAQFFGIPQRRRRVFVAGYLGDWRRAAAVLFERESLRGNPPTRRQIQEEPTGALGGDPGELGGRNDFERCAASASAHLSSIDGAARGAPLVAFTAKDYAADAGHLAPTLRAMPHAASHANGGGQIAICIQEGQTGVRQHATAGAIRSSAPGTQPGGSLVMDRMTVRRLMPVECERLQGLPDGYTLIPFRGKPAADAPRYRAIGNSMATPVLRWIGRRIQRVDGFPA